MAGSSDYQIALIIAIGTVGMLLLAIAIVLFMVFYQKKMIQEQYKRQRLELDYQQKMMEAALVSQENERRRVAGDLHDSVGGMLSAIRVGLTTIARQLPDPGGIEQSKKMLDDTIESVRAISRDLMPSTLERFGLVHAVGELCERFHTTTHLSVLFHEEGELKELDKRQQLMIFRIVQELINNAVKHAQASEIQVTIRSFGNLEMFVEDNGIGFDAKGLNKSNSGLGLFNIENRVRLLGAKLEHDQARERGSKITMTMPL